MRSQSAKSSQGDRRGCEEVIGGMGLKCNQEDNGFDSFVSERKQGNNNNISIHSFLFDLFRIFFEIPPLHKWLQ